jgi:predicted TIM-barrel fold metal-dependent hydrolase
MDMIIDTHGYIGSNKRLNTNIQPEAYRELQKQVLTKHGYDIKFLVMTYSMHDNIILPTTIQENQDVFLGGILQINPNVAFERILGYSSPQNIENIVKQGGVVGLKLHTSATETRVDDSSLDDFASLAVDYNLPFVFHCSATGQDFTNPNAFRRLKDKYPELIIVFAHYGGLNEEFIPEYFKLLQEYPHLYMNTTGLSGEIARYDFRKNEPLKVIVKEPDDYWVDFFLRTIEPIQDQVAFGSDYNHLRFDLNPIDKANEKIQKKILVDNPKKIFNLNI